ncbi:hypothetical protein BBP40_012110 [Aspergillus hancockii]|nr:hypothetical protein BBP40_012110 [Aspergillus hancockii]
MQDKANVLLIGCGGIGTICALNLETGGKRQSQPSFGRTMNMSKLMVSPLRETAPYKYIICTTKNYADIPPTVAELIRPAVTPGYSIVILLQNDLNIELPVIAAFPDNIVLSDISFCGSHEVATRKILHEDDDELYVGAFCNPTKDLAEEDQAAREFCQVYGAGGNASPSTTPTLNTAVGENSLTDLDTGRIQLADGALEILVRPAMEEIRAASKACGHDLPAELVDFMIMMDPITMYNSPSMQVDLRKGRFCEYENIIGEPLKEGKARGVPMPTLSVLYGILKSIQWRTKQKHGLVTIPDPEDHTIQK